LCYLHLCPITSLHYTIRTSRQNNTYSDDHESRWGWVLKDGESTCAIRIYVQSLLFTIPYVHQDRRRLTVTTMKVGEGGFLSMGNRIVLFTSMSHNLISTYYIEIKAKQNLQWQAWNSVRVGFQWRQIWLCDPQQCLCHLVSLYEYFDQVKLESSNTSLQLCKDRFSKARSRMVAFVSVSDYQTHG
jgi:hypothetical protein